MTDAELQAYEDEAIGGCSSCVTLVREVRRLASELASERSTSAGLRAQVERTRAEAFDGFDRLARERDDALRELRKLQAKSLPPVPVSPNVPSDGEVN